MNKWKWWQIKKKKNFTHDSIKDFGPIRGKFF